MRRLVAVDPRQVRTHPVRWTKAYRYARLMEAGAVFPPPRVARLPGGSGFWCKDGAHRTLAHRLLGRAMVVRVADRPLLVLDSRPRPRRRRGGAEESFAAPVPPAGVRP